MTTDLRTVTDEEQEHLNTVMDQLGVAPGARLQFMAQWGKLTKALTANPQEELKFRLNARLRGDDPGTPVNTQYWRTTGGN